MNQNEIPIKMTATKKQDLNNLGANLDRKTQNAGCTFGTVTEHNCNKLFVQLKSITDLTVMTEMKINVLIKLGY